MYHSVTRKDTNKCFYVKAMLAKWYLLNQLDGQIMRLGPINVSWCFMFRCPTCGLYDPIGVLEGYGEWLILAEHD